MMREKIARQPLLRLRRFSLRRGKKDIAAVILMRDCGCWSG
jgi:hypothetical protein